MGQQQSNVQRLLDKMDSGEAVLGTLLWSPSPELVEIMAHVGFDYIRIDQMFSAVGENELAHMIRAARGSDMAIIVRPMNDPWFGGDDPGLPARVTRALALGADGVKVSVFSVTEAEWILAAGRDWHKMPWISRRSADNVEEIERDDAEATLIIPGIESEAGVRDFERILELDGLRVASGHGGTDTTIALGYPLQYEHPEVLKYVARMVAKARECHVHLAANTGYAFRTEDEITDRIARLIEQGNRMIMIQSAEFLLQMTSTRLVRNFRNRLKVSG